MTWLLPLLLVLIFAAAVGFLYPEGMWSNAIRLVNVITASLLATNYFEPVARWLEGMADTYTFFWDFIALWGLFALFVLIFTALTEVVSRVKVRFLKIADRIGSAVFAAWIGWVMVCFTMVTLHTAPLAREPFFGGFKPENGKMFLGIYGPDREWLGFMQRMSRGPFCRADESGQYAPDYYRVLRVEPTASKEKIREAYDNLAKEYDPERNPGNGDSAKFREVVEAFNMLSDPKYQHDRKLAVFDYHGSFLLKYATRRAECDSYRMEKNAFRVRSEDRGKGKLVELDKR